MRTSRGRRLGALTGALLTLTTGAQAQQGKGRPWDNLGANVAEAFSGTNLLWHGSAIAVTAAMAESELDYDLRVFAQNNIHAKAYADTALYGGYVLPVVLAPSIYVIGLGTKSRRTSYAGAASIQALVVTGAATGLLKWGTGRPFPNNGRSPEDPYKLEHREDGRLSAFAPFNKDVFLAWPSGHTASTMSIAAALYGFAPENWWALYLGYPLALGIGFGMVVGDHHWGSDVLAGAMLGHAVGYSIGRSFRRDFDGVTGDTNRSSIQVRGVQAVPESSGLRLIVFGTL